jgi:hypothetical protein
MTTPQQYLLVKLAPDLAAHMTTFRGVWAGIISRPGVESITDLAYVTQETLDTILMSPEQAPAPKRKRRKVAA